MRKVLGFVSAFVLLSATGVFANEYTDGEMVAKKTSLTDLFYLAPKDEVEKIRVENKHKVDGREAGVVVDDVREEKSENVLNEFQSLEPVVEEVKVEKDNVIDVETQKDVVVSDEFSNNDVNEADTSFLEGFSFGAGLGGLGGVNATIGYRIPRRDSNFWKNRFGFRLDYNTWKPLKKSIDKYFEDNPVELDDEPIDISIKGHNFGAIVDFYPFGNTWGLGNFRLSGGYYVGDFEVSGTLHRQFISDDVESFVVGDKVYVLDDDTSPDLYLNAKLKADVTGPYAGVGFDMALMFGLKFFFDVGVVFIDKPIISTDVYGSGRIDIYSVNEGVVIDEGYLDLSNMNTESQKKLEKMKSDFRAEYEDELEFITKKYFPMVKIGLLYRF